MPEETPPDWTVEGAGAYLPRLRTLLGILRRAAHIAARARGNGHSKSVAEVVGTATDEVTEPTGASEGTASADDVTDADALGAGALPTPQQALDELAERGVILRDPARGLVDFPSRRPSGRLVLLCWQLGEDELAWWHLPEDGFAGRRPLPVPPEI